MCDEDIRTDMPDGWWLSTPPPKVDRKCQYLLAALVHRNNSDVIPEATDGEAGDTRSVVRKKVKNQRAAEVAAAKTAPQTKKGEIEESMMMTKAALMEQSHYLQNLKGVRDQLDMLKEFKSSFVSRNGDNEYNDTVCDLLGELPIMKKRKSREEGDNGRGGR